MAKKPAWQVQQEAERARYAAEARAEADARYATAKAAEIAYKEAEAARIAALTPEQRAAEEAEKIARWNANHQEEIRTFEARRRAAAPPAYPIKPVDLLGEPE